MPTTNVAARDLRGLRVIQPLVRLQPGRPAYVAGVRTAAGLAVPLLTGVLAGKESVGGPAGFGGLMVALSDTGGPYATRARFTITATIIGAAEVFVATLAANTAWLAAVTMFAVAGATGFSAAFGPHAGPFGLCMALVCAITLGTPGDLDGAYHAAIWFAVGGLWSVTLSLVLWPLHRWSPQMAALSQTYGALARFTRLTLRGDEQALAARQRMRQARAAAEDCLAVVSLDRTTSRAQGEVLILLLRQASVLINDVIALADAAGRAPGPGGPALADRSADALDVLARALLTGQDPGATAAFVPGTGMDADVMARTHALAADIARAGALTSALHSGSRPDPVAAQDEEIAFQVARVRHKRLWRTIRANLTRRSDVGRHSLRLATTCAVGVGIYSVLGLSHGFWVPLTILIVQKPDIGGTFDRTVQRVVGTLIGAVAAAVLAAVVTEPWADALLTAPLAFAMVAFLPYNYVFWTMCITPLIILLEDVGDPGDWTVVGWRILNTLIGCTLGLLGGFALWPSWQQRTLPLRLAELLGAETQLLRAIAAAEPDASETACARLRDSLLGAVRCSTNADESLTRLLAEPTSKRPDTEALTELAASCRHCLDVLIALQVPAHADGSARDSAAELSTLVPHLEELRDAVSSRATVAVTDWPTIDNRGDAAYLEKQVRAVADAASRWARARQTGQASA